jgi:hypothetical protein
VHSVSIANPDYDTWSDSITVKRRPINQASTQAPADAPGQRFALFIIDTKPPGMEIYIDGKPYGRGRVEASLPAGLHKWKVLMPMGNPPVESEMTLRAGEVSKKTVSWVNGSVPRIEGGL